MAQVYFQALREKRQEEALAAVEAELTGLRERLQPIHFPGDPPTFAVGALTVAEQVAVVAGLSGESSVVHGVGHQDAVDVVLEYLASVSPTVLAQAKADLPEIKVEVKPPEKKVAKKKTKTSGRSKEK